MNAEYRTIDKKAVIFLLARDKNKNRKIFSIPNYKPHFWAADPSGPLRDIFNRPIREIDTFHPSDVTEKRKEFSYHDEANIKFPWRYLIDKKIFCGFKVIGKELVPCADQGIPPHLGLFDLEVETPPEIMARPENPIWPIVSFQFHDNYPKDLTLFMLDTVVKGEPVSIPKSLEGCVEAITLPITFHLKQKNETFLDIIKHPTIYHYDNEKKMIHDVTTWSAERQFDGMGGYNSNLFDFPYWIRRANILHLDIRHLSPFGKVQCSPRKDQDGKWRMDPYVKGVQLIDLYDMYKKWTGGRQPIVKGRPFGTTYDFHLVMEFECGFYYVDLGDKVKESRLNNPYAWTEYVCGDAYALGILEEQKKIVAYFDRFRRNVGVPLTDALHNSRLGEMRMLRLRDRPLPSRQKREKSRVKGAIVLLPKRKGIHENIVVVDIKTLYPALIVIYNLSPETLDPKGEIKIGPMEDGTILRFKKSPIGIIPKATMFDMDLREVYRKQLKGMSEKNPKWEPLKQLETLHKFMSCSYYGMTGYEGFILYSDEVRKAITFCGREALQECAKVVERQGYEVMYGDTDGLFIKLSGKQYREGFVIEGVVNRALRSLSWTHNSRYALESKFEHFCKRIIFVPKVQRRKGVIVTAKKRYAFIDEKDNLNVTGLAPRRSSTPSVARDNMMEWLKLILIKSDTKTAISIVRSLWENLSTMPLNTVGLPRGIHKDKYGARNPWIEGRDYMHMYYNKMFREDKKPLLIYMDRAAMERAGFHGARSARCVCITERDIALPEDISQYVDWATMREKVVTANFKQLFDAIGIHWNEVINRESQRDLAGKGTVEISMKRHKRVTKASQFMEKHPNQQALGGWQIG